MPIPDEKFIPGSIEKAFQLQQFEHSYFLIVVFLLTLSIWKVLNQGSMDRQSPSLFGEPYLWRTLSEFILIWTMIGARCVFIIWFGWLIVSASITTSWSPRASSKILSTSLWTSTKQDLISKYYCQLDLHKCGFAPAFCSLRARSACFANDKSADILVIFTRPSNWRRMKSKIAFCIISVTYIQNFTILLNIIQITLCQITTLHDLLP